MSTTDQDEGRSPSSTLERGDVVDRERRRARALGGRSPVDRALAVLVVVGLLVSVGSLFLPWVAFRSPYLAATGQTMVGRIGWGGGPAELHRILAPALLVVLGGLVKEVRLDRVPVVAALGSALVLGTVLAARAGMPDGATAGTDPMAGWWLAAAGTLVSMVAATLLALRPTSTHGPGRSTTPRPRPGGWPPPSRPSPVAEGSRRARRRRGSMPP